MKLLKNLAKTLRKCWYDNHGKYAQVGKWEVGLGGYDCGYEFCYKTDHYGNIPVFSVRSNNELCLYQDINWYRVHCKCTVAEILNSLKTVEPLLELAVE